MARYDDMNNRMIAILGIIGVILTIVSIVGLEAVYYAWQQGWRDARAERTVHAPSSIALEEQQARLHQYGWLDKEHTTAVLPIEQAMQKVIQETTSRAP